MTTYPEPLPPIANKSKTALRAPWAATANWLVGLTAAVLLAASVGGYLYDRKQRETITAAYLRLQVTGPAALQAGTPAEFSMTTTTITGEPLPSSIEFSLHSPDGKCQEKHVETSDESGRLRVAIPAELALPARAELVVTAVHAGLREEVKTVLAVQPAQLATQLTLDKAVYRPGETVYYRSLTLARYGLTAAGAGPVHFEVLDPSGVLVPKSPLEGLTDRGVGNGVWAIPEDARQGQYTLVARSMDHAFAQQERSFVVRRASGAKAAAKNVPGEIAVTFYPEGGALVPGLENRVYFSARDPLGKPVHLQGLVAASDGQDVAVADTNEEFSLVPSEGLSYRLKISNPKGIGQEPPLPAVASDRKIVVSAGSGVFAAGAPLEFTIRAAKEGIPLAVVARCRGVPVGEQTLITTLQGRDHGAIAVVVPLDEQAGGVIHLTVYDYSSSPPQVVAQRAVYRPMARRLTVRAAEHPAPYAPGGKVGLTAIVANEKGDPVGAVLGLSVVGRKSLGPSGGRPLGAVAPFLCGGEADGPGEFDGAEFYLSDDKDAAVAMDLLLGTQAGRPVAEAGAPPLMFDNLNQLRAQYEKSLSQYQETRTQVLRAVVALCFFGGLGLLLFVTMLALLKIVSGLRLWLPTVAVAACCVLIGLGLMEPGRHKMVQKAVPFVPSSVNPPAEAGDRPRPAKDAALKTLKTFTVSPYAYHLAAGSPRRQSDGGETLYWNPLAIAGPDGRVQIDFDLPDGLAAFEVRADACGDGRIGCGRWEVATKAEGGGRKGEGGHGKAEGHAPSPPAAAGGK